MSTSSNNLPPQIQKLLKEKGWTWPPDEKLKKQIHEAMERSSGSLHVREEDLPELLEGIRGFEHVCRNKKL
ncbi:hypothetical protein HYR99_12795 [Candidatus Poribacteria bacterium]|nr:hypothetical protein [Candidatus Poribacteria bacterium]